MDGASPRRWKTIALATLAALLLAGAAQAQFGFGRGFRGVRVATATDFEGKWHYCRLMYRGGGFGGGGSWTTDYPMADQNLMIRTSELTRVNVSRFENGQPNHLVVPAYTDDLFKCPFVILSAPGAAFFTDEEAQRLRQYLLKGGML